MNKLGAILFDVDGTLADTEELHRQAFNIAFAEFGLDWYWNKAQYAQLLGVSGGPDRIRHFARTQALDPQFQKEPQTFILSLYAAKSTVFRRLLAENGAALRPGVRRLLDEARQADVKLALATCTSMTNVRQLLDQNLPSDWPTWFSAIVTAADVREMKPAPDVYLKVLNRLELPAKACVAIEDTVNGSNAACAAGLASVVTTHEFTQQCAFPGAKLIISHLGEPQQPFELTTGSLNSKQTYVDIATLTELIADPGARRNIAYPNSAAMTCHTTQPHRPALAR